MSTGSDAAPPEFIPIEEGGSHTGPAEAGTPGPAAPTTHVGRSTRRTVLLTLAAVALVILIAGGGGAAYFAYDRQAGELAKAEEQVDRLTGSVATLQAEVQEKSGEANREYYRGLKEGRESERKLNDELGLDYDSGYNEAFAGFGEWQTNAYYFVKIIKGEGKQKYEIASMGLMEPCKSYYAQGESVWTQNKSC